MYALNMHQLSRTLSLPKHFEESPPFFINQAKKTIVVDLLSKIKIATT
jgi:hypothetical protein